MMDDDQVFAAGDHQSRSANAHPRCFDAWKLKSGGAARKNGRFWHGCFQETPRRFPELSPVELHNRGRCSRFGIAARRNNLSCLTSGG